MLETSLNNLEEYYDFIPKKIMLGQLTFGWLKVKKILGESIQHLFQTSPAGSNHIECRRLRLKIRFTKIRWWCTV